jgi:hypothetical protein
MEQDPSRDDGKSLEAPQDFHPPAILTTSQEMKTAAILNAIHYHPVGKDVLIVLFVKNDKPHPPFGMGYGQFHGGWQKGIYLQEPLPQKEQQVTPFPFFHYRNQIFEFRDHNRQETSCAASSPPRWATR